MVLIGSVEFSPLTADEERRLQCGPFIPDNGTNYGTLTQTIVLSCDSKKT
eukprot:SAG31_NODE_28756_length_405_cov_1.166667_1_plen_49_part_10